jgi:tRNA (guanine-N7-)-methyltransferase
MPLSPPKAYYRSLGPLLDRQTLAKGPDWPALFGRDAPRELEIGFGNGEFLRRSSLAAPERDFIGLEIAWSSIKRALRRLADPPRPNVKLVLSPAKPALELLFPERSLAAARALFPVPWPREGHADKRLLSSAFLSLVANRLEPGGLFQLVTDSQALADWTLEQAKDSALHLTMAEKPAFLDTKYERKWHSHGQESFFHLEGRPADSAPPPLNGLLDMRPIYLDRLDPAAYRPKGQTGPVSVVFGDFLFDPARQEGLLFAKVAEEGFVQEFFIRATRQADGRWKLFPAIYGQALPTAGVQLALNLAANLEPAPRD